MPKVLHIISNLTMGGAETMLLRLLERTDLAEFPSEVVSLMDVSVMGERIRATGVPVRALGIHPRRPNPLGLLRLAREIRRVRPDVIQTWMYHADLLGGLAALLAGRPPVVWGIRHSTLDASATRRRTIWTARLCARLSSRVPTRITCCSETGRRVHVQLGYQAEKMQVIPNGFDLSRFQPEAEARVSLRQELALPGETPLIGLIARFAPEKDHANFIRAAGRLAQRCPDVHFVLCGRGVTPENSALAAQIDSEGLAERCHLLGDRDDVPRLTPAFDLATCSSSSESFPQILGEAMACGVPCVTTDVGDAALIVGETGRVVPSRDPEALANAWGDLLDAGADERQRLGQLARDRIGEQFAIDDVVARYHTLYRELADAKRLQ
jgi:glycosyltransferase involved in cell wall biosynthesis